MLFYLFETIRALILSAAMSHYVDQSLMLNIALCETGRTLNPYLSNGQYQGLYQLGAYAQAQFYVDGYDNIWDPSQQANWAGEQLHAGAGRRLWLACGGR